MKLKRTTIKYIYDFNKTTIIRKCIVTIHIFEIPRKKVAKN